MKITERHAARKKINLLRTALILIPVLDFYRIEPIHHDND